jgi:ribosomal protein L12E/L44/L45/RPP1/RPP2
MSSKAGVLPVVLAALQRVGKINQALRSRDQQGSTPLALATSSPRFFDNFSALLAACDINTPEVIQWKNKGADNLIHVAVGGRCIPALKVLVARDDIKGCLLEMNARGSTPLQQAKSQMQVSQNQLQMQKRGFEFRAATMKLDSFARQFHERMQLGHITEIIESLKEIISTLEQPTAEAKAAAAAAAAAEAMKQKEETKRQEIKDNCFELLDKSDWPHLLMLIRSRDAIQQTTALEVVYSATRKGNVDESSSPILNEEDFQSIEVSVCL